MGTTVDLINRGLFALKLLALLLMLALLLAAESPHLLNSRSTKALNYHGYSGNFTSFVSQ